MKAKTVNEEFSRSWVGSWDAALIHEMDAFTRGGDPYEKLGLGYGRYIKDAYAYWLTIKDARKYFVHFPVMDLTAEIIFGFVNVLGRTELTDDPDQATTMGLMWEKKVEQGEFSGPKKRKIIKILAAWFHDNEHELVASAQNGM